MVDDHPMMRRDVTETLSEEADLELVGAGAFAHDAMRLPGQARPDLILLDIAMPGGGIDVAKGPELRHAGPSYRLNYWPSIEEWNRLHRSAPT